MRLSRPQLLATMFGLAVLCSVFSIALVSFKFGTDSRQDADIGDVRVRVDRETRSRVAELERQRAIDMQQDKIQTSQIARNRQLLLSILKLRDKNPELFEGITLPTTAGYIARSEANDEAKAAVESAAERPKPTASKPRPAKPKPSTVKPKPKPEVTTPTPRPTDTTPAPTATPPEAASPSPQPTAPAPVTPAPVPPPSVVVIPPAQPVPPRPIIPLPPIIAPIVGPLLPPILNPIVG